MEKAFALAQDSDNERNLALAYLGVGKSKEATGHVIQILAHEKEGTWQDDFLLGTAALQMGNYKLASHELGLTVQLKPDFAEAQAAMASLPSAGKPYSQPVPFAQPVLPYSTLVIKSEAWPYYP